MVLTATLPGPNPSIDPVAETVTVVAASAVTKGMRRDKKKVGRQENLRFKLCTNYGILASLTFIAALTSIPGFHRCDHDICFGHFSDDFHLFTVDYIKNKGGRLECHPPCFFFRC